MRFKQTAAVLCLALALAATDSAQAQVIDQAQQYREATVELTASGIVDGKPYGVLCTGVILSLRTDRVFIVTAGHCIPPTVIREMRVHFAFSEGTRSATDQGTALQLYDATGKPTARRLDNITDVAAIPFQYLAHPEVPPGETLRAVGVADFAAAEDVTDGAPIFVFGFPNIANLEGRAITRSGVIAWTDPLGRGTRPFLVDATLLPGNSGGPVFENLGGMRPNGVLVLGNQVRILGIAVETLVTTVDVKGAAGSSTITVLAGVGVIEPISKIRQLLELMSGPPKAP